MEHDLEMKNRIQTENLNTNYANLANIAKKTLKLRGFRLFRAFRVEKEIVLKRLLIISRLKTPCFGKIFLPRLTTVIPKGGTARFWRFFGMNFLVSLPFIIVIVGLVGAGLFAAIAADSAAGAKEFLVGFIPAICVIFCCLFIFSLVVGMIVQQASNAMILEDLGISASLIRGWDVFKNNLGHLLLMAIILFIFGVIAGVILALPFLLILIPAAVSFVLGSAQSTQPLILMGVCLAAYLPIAIVANGILTTYVQAAWTLFYLQLTEQTPEITKEDTIYRICVKSFL